MSLLHALIAHEQTVVAEHSVSAPSTSTPATYNEACQSILRKLPAGSSRLTYAAGEILVHYVKRESWTAMCVADQQAGRRVPFTFLARALDRFMQLHGSAHDALQPPKPYEYQSSFGHQLAKMMDGFDAAEDPAVAARAELDGVREIMTKNIDAVLSRGERIDLLVSRTEALSTSARSYRIRSTQTRRKMWWRNKKSLLAVVLVVLLVVYLIIASACGFGLSQCKR